MRAEVDCDTSTDVPPVMRGRYWKMPCNPRPSSVMATPWIMRRNCCPSNPAIFEDNADCVANPHGQERWRTFRTSRKTHYSYINTGSGYLLKFYLIRLGLCYNYFVTSDSAPLRQTQNADWEECLIRVTEEVCPAQRRGRCSNG